VADFVTTYTWASPLMSFSADGDSDSEESEGGEILLKFHLWDIGDPYYDEKLKQSGLILKTFPLLLTKKRTVCRTSLPPLSTSFLKVRSLWTARRNLSGTTVGKSQTLFGLISDFFVLFSFHLLFPSSPPLPNFKQ
jgi:hypothetical protein